MLLLRTRLVQRIVALSAMLCLIGVSVMPSFAHRATFVSYGEWLRSQVRGEVGDEFEEALRNAASQRATSIEQFLHVFVDSWSEHADLDALAGVFGIDGLEGSLLVSQLKSRYAGLAPDALPVRTVLTVPSKQATSGSDRFLNAEASSEAARTPLAGFAPLPATAQPAPSITDALLTSMPRLGP
jgi:hypothetical protein